MKGHELIHEMTWTYSWNDMNLFMKWYELVHEMIWTYYSWTGSWTYYSWTGSWTWVSM